MTETTKLPASFSNSTVFESSTAFLMVQKNNNKRQTSMTDDVFRIFRRTGKNISQIANKIEKERDLYLKESYSNKNALYKELASIPSLKEISGPRRTKALSHMPSLPRFADVHTSDLICRPVKSQLSRQRHGQETELELEKRINVNVLKRCECCRRLAFRYKEMSEKMLLMEEQKKEKEEEEKQKKESRETNSAKNDEITISDIQKLIDEASSAAASRQAYDKPEGKNEQTRLFQYSSRKTSEVRIPANQRVETSFRSLKKQSLALQSEPTNLSQTPQPPRLTTVPSPTKSDRGPRQERSWSILFDKCSFTVPPEPSPSPLGRQKIRVKFEHPHLKEKLKISGQDWSNHLLNLQAGRGSEGEKQTVVTLSKAYLAFKKLLHKMEEERKTEEEMAGKSDSSDGSSSGRDSPIPRNRFLSDVSMAASLRWQPNRRKSQINSIISLSNPTPTLDQITLMETNKKNSYRLSPKGDDNDKLSDCGSDVGHDGRFTVLDFN